MNTENNRVFEKIMALAKAGKGRRMLNALNKAECVLTPAQLEKVLETYCREGLPVEVDMLKKRRGILTEQQYDAMAEEVRLNASLNQYQNFLTALRTLLQSGMTMNPTKMQMEESA